MELSKAIEEGSKAAITVPFTPSKSQESKAPFTVGGGSEDREPYNVAITRPPSMRHMEPVFEPDGRWPEEGRWFG
jgi:hypothetical protein